jgi:hypothetical protein
LGLPNFAFAKDEKLDDITEFVGGLIICLPDFQSGRDSLLQLFRA